MVGKRNCLRERREGAYLGRNFFERKKGKHDAHQRHSRQEKNERGTIPLAVEGEIPALVGGLVLSWARVLAAVEHLVFCFEAFEEL